MILSDIDIREFISTGEIVIEDFSGELQPASYELRVGTEAMMEEGVYNIADKKYIAIPRGATVVMYPFEKIKLSNKIAGRYGLRSRFARRGLILLSGPQIDPGFEGILTITVFNSGTSEVIVSYMEKFAKMEFSLLRTPASKGYHGAYQGQSRISSAEIELVTREYRNFSEIEDSITKMQADLNHLSQFIYVVLFGIIVGAVVVILQVLLSK